MNDETESDVTVPASSDAETADAAAEVDADATGDIDAVASEPARRRRLSLVFGLGALVALIVMVVLVVRDPTSGGPDRVPGLPTDALTLGVQDDQLATADISDLGARLDRVRATGVTVTRVDVAWADIAPTQPADPADPDDPAYVWARTDAVLDGLRQREIRVILVISASPGWANGGRGREWAPEAPALGDFVRAAMSRYDKDRVDIIAVEPWNEPNNPGYLMPQWDGVGPDAAAASPATYAGLVREVREALSGTGVALVGPSTADIASSAPGVGGVSVTDFVGALAEVTPAPAFDATAQHIQPQASPGASADRVPSLAALPELLALFDRIAPGRDLLLTRIGFATPPGGMTSDAQSTALTEAFEVLRAEPRVRLMVWGPLQDTIENPAGLITTAGADKPALAVFTRTPKELDSATP